MIASPKAERAPFLKNTWYVAAWSSEVAPGKLFHREILGEHVLLFRTEDGTPAAMSDRCPHRFAPLHMGKLKGDVVECGYHGLQFDRKGVCVFNPHGPTPAAARTRSYPLVERYNALWIWMGVPEKAQANDIPSFDFLISEHWYVGTDQMLINANYEIETDNIMDLSHIEFVHPLFSTEQVRHGKTTSSQEENTVWSKRFITEDALNPWLRAAFQIPEGMLADRWLDVRWNAPALMALYAGAVVSGRPRSEGLEVQQAHFFTPQTQDKTHYFYSISFPRAMGPMGDTLAREQVRALREPFEREDKPFIEGVARMMNDDEFWSLKPLLLAGDAGAVKARRVLAKMIESERSSK